VTGQCVCRLDKSKSCEQILIIFSGKVVLCFKKKWSDFCIDLDSVADSGYHPLFFTLEDKK